MTDNSLCSFENIYTELDRLAGLEVYNNNKISIKNVYVGVANTQNNYTGFHLYGNSGTEVTNLDVDGQFYNDAVPIEGNFTHILCDNNSSSTSLINYKISNTTNPQFISNTNFDTLHEEGKKINFPNGVYTSNSSHQSGHFQMGNYHFWVDTAGKLRIKNGAPTSDLDGDIVGSQA